LIVYCCRVEGLGVCISGVEFSVKVMDLRFGVQRWRKGV